MRIETMVSVFVNLTALAMLAAGTTLAVAILFPDRRAPAGGGAGNRTETTKGRTCVRSGPLIRVIVLLDRVSRPCGREGFQDGAHALAPERRRCPAKASA